MVLELEWQLKLADNLLLEGELKAERHYQRKIKWLSLKV